VQFTACIKITEHGKVETYTRDQVFYIEQIILSVKQILTH